MMYQTTVKDLAMTSITIKTLMMDREVVRFPAMTDPEMITLMPHLTMMTKTTCSLLDPKAQHPPHVTGIAVEAPAVVGMETLAIPRTVLEMPCSLRLKTIPIMLLSTERLLFLPLSEEVTGLQRDVESALN